MKKLDTPKRVTLGDGRTFTARFKRVKRSELPDNIVMRRTYRNNFAKGARKKRTGGGRRGRKKQQRGKGFFSVLKKVVKNPIFKDIVKTGAKYSPGLYQGGVKKIKNKKLKSVLQSDITSGLVNNLSNRIQ